MRKQTSIKLILTLVLTIIGFNSAFSYGLEDYLTTLADFNTKRF